MNRKMIAGLAILAGLVVVVATSVESSAQCCRRGRLFQRVSVRGMFQRQCCPTTTCGTQDCGTPVASCGCTTTPAVATNCCNTGCAPRVARCNTCCNTATACAQTTTAGYVSTHATNSCGSCCASTCQTSCCKTSCCKTRRVRCCKPRRVRCCANPCGGCTSSCGSCSNGCSPAPAAGGVEPTPAGGSEPPKPGDDT